MQFSDPSRPVLFLGAHPDDEIACGGTVRKLTQMGREVYYAYMSNCAESTQALGFEPSQLIEECYQSCAYLGIARENIIEHDFPVRHLPAYRQEILEELVKIRRELNPSLVLVASRFDIHQDHATVSAEAIRAFKYATILGYEFAWNQLESHLNMFVSLTDDDMKAKIASWSCYKSQAARAYHGEELMRSLAKIRGIQSGFRMAEGFETIRAVSG